MWLFISQFCLLKIYPAVISQWQFLGFRQKYSGRRSWGDLQIEFIRSGKLLSRVSDTFSSGRIRNELASYHNETTILMVLWLPSMQMLLNKVLLSNVLPTTIELVFFIALSLFPGTEKGEFDYVCIVVSFKSSIVLNCAKNGLRETLILRQLRKMNNKEQRRKGDRYTHVVL